MRPWLSNRQMDLQAAWQLVRRGSRSSCGDGDVLRPLVPFPSVANGGVGTLCVLDRAGLCPDLELILWKCHHMGPNLAYRTMPMHLGLPRVNLCRRIHSDSSSYSSVSTFHTA